MLEVFGVVLEPMKGLTRWIGLQNLYSVRNLRLEKTMLKNRDQMERSYLSELLRKKNMIKNQSN